MPELQQIGVMGEGLAFPEGPVALSDGGVLVVELMGGRLTRVDPDGSTTTIAQLGGGPNGAAIGPDGAVYICNNGGIDRSTRIGGRIQRVEFETGQVDTLYTAHADGPLLSPNDLVFDAVGGMWFTDHAANGSIFYCRSDGSQIRRVLNGVPSPNGIGLSPDGSVLYWALTHQRQVHRARVVGPGQLAPSVGYGIRPLVFTGEVDRFALVAGLPGGHELDSLAVDSSGAVVVGTLVDAGLSEITPDGQWTLHTLPASLTEPAMTNVCFGGPDLTTAFITCSLTGRLLRCQWHRPGLALAFGR
jgi:gluconolactonase